MKYEYMKPYEITFYDHFIDETKKEVICKTVGYFLEKDKNYLHFSYWIVNTDDKELFENNLEKFSVLRSTINKSKKVS